MPALLVYGLCCVVPAGTFWAFDYFLRRSSRPRRGTRDRDLTPVGPSLQRLVSDLHRLEDDYRRIERSDLPAKAHRLHAVSLAYDDTLRCCCLALGLPMPEHSPLSSFDRLQVEADLAQHGLLW